MDFLMMADQCLGFGVCIVGKELRISTSSRWRHELSHPSVYNSSDNLSWSVQRSTLLPQGSKNIRRPWHHKDISSGAQYVTPQKYFSRPRFWPTLDEGPGSNFLGTNLTQIECLSWTVPWCLAWFLVLRIWSSTFSTVFGSQPIDFPSKTGAMYV
jgi:hypothetical protein